MALIDIRTFSGMRPALASHLLEQAEAQIVYGTDLSAGELRPVLLPRQEKRTNSMIRSLWLHGEQWRLYADRRRFAESPVAGNRLLFSSREAGGLRMCDAESQEYALGLTPPDAVPTLKGKPFPKTGSILFRSTQGGFTFVGEAFPLYPGDKIVFTGEPPAGVMVDTVYLVLAQTEGVYSFATEAKPTEAVEISADGQAVLKVEASGETQTRVYVFTVVGPFGEESAPCPPSAAIVMDAALGVTLGNLLYARTGDEAPIVAKRLYRTATGTKGTDYLFVAEVGPDVTNFIDNLTDAELAEVLPGAHWLPPSPELRHLVELPGGILAAHDGEQVHLCEAYRPYAWPEANRFAVRGGIVALAASQRTLFALTESSVHALTVENPSEAYTTTLDGYTPCLSPDGVTSTPLGVLFPSGDGLYLVTQGSTAAQNITEDLIGENGWRDLNPASFLAVWFDTTYMAFFEKTDGTRGALLLDFGRDNQARMRLLDTWGTALQVIPAMRRVYMGQQVGQTGNWRVCRMFAGQGTEMMLWRSKRFFLPARVNMAALLVEGDAPDVEDASPGSDANVSFWGGPIACHMAGEVPFGSEQSDRMPGGRLPVTGMIRVFGDGLERAIVPVRPGELMPLPAGYTAGKYELEVVSQLPVRRVALATTTGEILQG